MQHTFVALVQNRPGVLSRAINLFRRRGLNIETLTVNRTANPEVSRLTVVAEIADVRSVLAQLEKLVDVLEVQELQPVAPTPRRVHVPTPAPASAAAISQADGVA